VLCHIRERFWVTRVFNRRHEDQQQTLAIPTSSLPVRD
jgi:hypothetical protein